MKQWEGDGEGRVAAGLKRHKVEVHGNGVINAGCEGKEHWQRDLRGLALRYLDSSVQDIDQQSQSAMSTVIEGINGMYEYTPIPANRDFIVKQCGKIMKGERAKLKDKWAKTGVRPMNTEPAYWDKLVAYWESPRGLAKAEGMKQARACVTNPSRWGRAGVAGQAARLVISLTPFSLLLRCGMF